MRRKMLRPIAAIAVLSITIFGCAGSDEVTAMGDTTTMSETQTMAGDTDINAADEIAADVNITDAVDYNDMFESIENTAQYNLIDLVNTSPNLSTFVGLVKQAGMDDDLMREGEFTIFAPTNEAFARLPQEKLDMLMKPENKAMLMGVIMAHVLPSKVSSMQFNSSQRIQVSEDQYIPVDVEGIGRGVTVGGASILKSDVEASNGILHIVDNVIIPTSGTVIDGQ